MIKSMKNVAVAVVTFIIVMAMFVLPAYAGETQLPQSPKVAWVENNPGHLRIRKLAKASLRVEVGYWVSDSDEEDLQIFVSKRRKAVNSTKKVIVLDFSREIRYIHQLLLGEEELMKTATIRVMTVVNGIASDPVDLEIQWETTESTTTTSTTPSSTASKNGWVKENSNWYFYKNGVLVKDNWVGTGESQFRIGSNGAFVPGIYKCLDGNIREFAEVGGTIVVVTNPQGWFNGNKSFRDADGTVCTGWIQVDDKYFHFNEEGMLDGESDGSQTTGSSSTAISNSGKRFDLYRENQ
jgi:glucan-binding YG repeat protein